ncbi:MAG: hypothetical protein IBX39_06025 [Candidatus Methanoperedenaceae archaeon]|nr:hypothetical protein [Candidatus Methanoperedenaceae archaeon]
MFNSKNREQEDSNEDKYPEMGYVKPDGSRSVDKDGVKKKGVFKSTHKWARQSQSIARSISKNEMSGLLSKNVVVQPNEVAVIVKDGKIEDVIESGKVKVGGLFSPGNYSKDVEVVMMDTSPKDSNWQVGELWTNDKHEVSAKGLLRYRVSDTKKFFSMVYAYSSFDNKGERYLSLEDINNRLKSEVLTRVLQPEAGGAGVDELYGNREFQLRIENELERQLKQTLDMWGIELLTFTSEWYLGDDYTNAARARREFETGEELKELSTLEAEGNFERGGRIDVAEVRAGHAPVSVEEDFRRQQALKETQAQLERERLEDEADFRAAQEALKLKEQLHLTKAKGMRAELEVEQDMKDKEHSRDMEYVKTVATAGGGDTARIISEGRELGKLSPDQIGALAKLREAEARAKDDKVAFMMNVEDRERADAYRRKELDAGLMDAAKPVTTGSTVRKCPGCGSTIPMQASFCGSCGSKIN